MIVDINGKPYLKYKERNNMNKSISVYIAYFDSYEDSCSYFTLEAGGNDHAFDINPGQVVVYNHSQSCMGFVSNPTVFNTREEALTFIHDEITTTLNNDRYTERYGMRTYEECTKLKEDEY